MPPISDDYRDPISHFTASVEELTKEIKELRREMARTYVRKDIYEIQQQDQNDNISFLTKVLWSVIGFVFTALGSAVMAVVLIP